MHVKNAVLMQAKEGLYLAFVCVCLCQITMVFFFFLRNMVSYFEGSTQTGLQVSETKDYCP
jgi:hypothetical protein